MQTGVEAAHSAVQGLAMYPNAVTIDAGDSITWTFPTHDVHTIALLGDDGTVTADSGIFFAGQSYTLTFTKTGVFTYYCILHADQGMVGTITVQ